MGAEEEGRTELVFRAQVDQRKQDRQRRLRLCVCCFKRPYIHIDHMPEAMAVKSAKMRDSESIQYELQVYRDLNNHGGRCPFIIEHYGEEVTWSDEGEEVYNLALEVAWGSLARLIKPQNILVVENEDDNVYRLVAKVADLGLAKKKDEVQERWRGTPMYLSPETILYNEQEEPSDIWALGCIILEMLTGECPRNHFYYHKSNTLYVVDGMVPKIPDTISSLARDFLGCCLAEEGSTAEEILSHPFVADGVSY
ncbi:mitogen-activated protein kinase kinase kinase 18-like [Rosa rugosa]|uniref:mitogen-activated protein kinase kinase kinase 18-like n=1 Tax=Rosa rugosa TaxID=74645 RepID=UPI002B404D27|nr:mitogen-activated protein kinase kinase kinase 18-like [Rosa rugosa]